MNSKIIIAIDAMGGENSPYKNIEGIALFLKKQSIDFESSNDSIVANINEENIPLILKKMVYENISITEMKQMRTLEELFLGLTK